MTAVNELRIFIALLAREAVLIWRNRLETAIALFFFLSVAAVFPLTMDPEPGILRKMGIAVILSSALLANLLTLERFFADDFRDGSLVQLMLLPVPLTLTVLAKIVIHYLSTGVMLAAVALIVALQYGMSLHAALRIMGVLLLIMPALSAIGALTSALTLGLQRGSLLPVLLHLPLCVPILIFSAIAMDPRGTHDAGVWYMLAAILLCSCFFLPMLAAQALKWVSE